MKRTVFIDQPDPEAPEPVLQPLCDPRLSGSERLELVRNA